MRDVVDKVAQCNVYSTLDMKSAYHQVELPADQQIFAAFEADGGLYQWGRTAFGLNNAAPCFQFEEVLVSGAEAQPHSKSLKVHLLNDFNQTSRLRDHKFFSKIRPRQNQATFGASSPAQQSHLEASVRTLRILRTVDKTVLR